MTITFIPIGFDVRHSTDQRSTNWDAIRRENYLLGDVEIPLSVDPLVWASIFDWRIGVGLSQGERKQLKLDGLVPPKWTGPNPNLWESYSELQEYMRLNAVSSLDFDTLLIKAHNEAVNSDGSRGRSACPSPPVDLGTLQFQSLGFDVADSAFTSCLLNCGYDTGARVAYQKKFLSYLNNHHLFIDVAAALEFALMRGAEIPEHAPFNVYELQLVISE